MNAPSYGLVEDALLKQAYASGRVLANVHFAMKALERGNSSEAYDSLCRAVEISDSQGER